MKFITMVKTLNPDVVTLDIDSPIPFDRIELKPVDNGQGSSGNNSDFLLINAKVCCPEDKFTEEFEYTLRDADGDEACATLKVDVKDTAAVMDALAVKFREMPYYLAKARAEVLGID